ncbi:uncharacterized protein I206_101860 [Kwoniella pini CBS 10737]|uniref:F-box domain-containing protein n=1 Tax=Kwoniella pini CBS 10737 TaxID=1296096 RepID=A0A1B9HVI0_9TREE|nr:uncharacterized protein I206_07049 [Kwoniella pini CBS 10737]OCF47271.1 hypothetical protein I206_07049 [Kwoniella pini CBS 10737]
MVEITSTETDKRGLETLPVELLIQIIENLPQDRSSLLPICRTSKLLREVASTYLWEHLTFNPGFRNKKTKQLPSILKTHNLHPENKFLLNSVETLSVHPHQCQWCNTLETDWDIELPNLKTLDINLLGYNTKFIGDPTDCWSVGQPCRLLRNLRPEHIILRVEGKGECDFHMNKMPPILQQMWGTVKTITLVSCYSNAIFDRFSEFFTSTIAPKAKNLDALTFVFDPLYLKALTDVDDGLDVNILDTSVNPTFDKYHLTFVAKLSRRYFKYSSETQLYMENLIRYAMESILLGKGWNKDDVKKRQQMIEIMPLQQWVHLEDGWKDKFSSTEVVKWKAMAEDAKRSHSRFRLKWNDYKNLDDGWAHAPGYSGGYM